MGTTRAGELLRTMSVRESLQEEGKVPRDPSVLSATRQLVSKLGLLAADELIEIRVVEVDPVRALYLRCQTGEVLAEIDTRAEC